VSTHHLGRMLALYRASRRWTVRDVAPQVGISSATISRIERGQTMDAATLLKLLDWLLRADDLPQLSAADRADARRALVEGAS
jgi:transcriptional regulator with XRE-family HTH domain